MGVLSSKLFTEGDPAVVKKLEDCATGRPSEVQSHFAQNANKEGEHIRRVQQALKNAQDLDPTLGIPPFEVNGKYDPTFARAVAAYKTKRGIYNYAHKIDDIIGIKTIQSLDNEAKKHKQVDPPPKPVKPDDRPRPAPFCETDANLPTGQNFEITMLMGVSGGEVAEVAKFYFVIRDTINEFSALYLFRGGGAGFGVLPVSGSAAGKPSPFTTDFAVKVSRFGPAAIMASFTGQVPIAVSETRFSLSYQVEGKKGLPQVPYFSIDTGPISIPGASVHVGQFKLLTVCRGEPGATRKRLGLEDVGPFER
jgi:hypothetical protein